MMQIPTPTAMQNWTLLAMRRLGGSGHNREIEEQVKELLKLPDELVDQLRSDGYQTVIDHRIAFARSHLKNAGLLDNPRRGVWTLTEAGAEQALGIPFPYADNDAAPAIPDGSDDTVADDSSAPDGEEWKEQLLARIMDLTPRAFERLCQLLLRESGFVQVQVDGGPGDEGIDGQGLLQMARLVSFPVVFQCKRWRNPVGPGVVRDFRGAMQGRADRGLIITTSTFTSAARKEAIRDGAPPIDLIDGLNLADNLRDLRLGVNVKEIVMENVIVDEAWFDKFQAYVEDSDSAGAIFEVG